jgi:hypothetical protein
LKGAKNKMITIQFNKDKKLYIIDVDEKGLCDINIYKINTENCWFSELGIQQDRLNKILSIY